ncbi:hypothetical protein B10525_17510 (plasmid) [Campylobacter jejuni]|nr:hypothetical protein B10525_17510 [Campylobacter jejuni]
MGHKESLEFKRWATRKPFEFHCNYTDKTLNKVKRIYNASKRIYLYVPFKDKEKAKSLGAMWDDKEKNGLLQKP